MERIQRLTYYLGIGIAATLFTLLLIIVVPNLAANWEYDARTDEEILAALRAHPAYAAMYERFPDAMESYDGHGSLRVGVRDFESGAQLMVYMDLYRDDNVSVYVECTKANGDQRDSVHDLFVPEFIRVTDCLEPAG